MRTLEQRADQSGNTYAMMMERAGRAVADAIAERVRPSKQRVLVLVGPGNNGGDGLVCARHLRQAGAQVALYLWKRTAKTDDDNFRMCIENKIPATRTEEDAEFSALAKLVAESTVIVDALIGTGVTRPIEGTLKELLAAVKAGMKRSNPALAELVPISTAERQAAPYVVAVDLPSGLNPDDGTLDPSALPADLTVTFAFPKVGQLTQPGEAAVGELVVADIGIRAEWADPGLTDVATAREMAARLPARRRDSHKGTFGKVMVCAGSANYVGAAYFAGSAATRSGAGLVTLALARGVYSIVAGALHEATYVVLPDDLGVLVPDAVPLLREQLADIDALLIGCGLGRAPKTIEFVQRLLGIDSKGGLQVGFMPPSDKVAAPRAALVPLVVDADALYALAQSGEWWRRLEPYAAILTPHPGEMATLVGAPLGDVQSDRIAAAKQSAARWRQVVVLKGANTVIAAPDGRAVLLPFATPALATAGTGDVLAGTIAGLLAQLGKKEPADRMFDAAVLGAYLHGLAGTIAEHDIGTAGVVARDLLPRLPEALRRTRASNV
jgi:NAD(P)H-hydrate epimerase